MITSGLVASTFVADPRRFKPLLDRPIEPHTIQPRTGTARTSLMTKHPEHELYSFSPAFDSSIDPLERKRERVKHPLFSTKGLMSQPSMVSSISKTPSCSRESSVMVSQTPPFRASTHRLASTPRDALRSRRTMASWPLPYG